MNVFVCIIEFFTSLFVLIKELLSSIREGIKENGKRKKKKFIVSLIVLLTIILSSAGLAEAAFYFNNVDHINLDNVDNFSYLEEIHETFKHKYSIEEYNDCYNLVHNTIINNLKTKIGKEQRNDVLPPSKFFPQNIKEHKDNVEQWRNRCEDSDVSENYRLFASAAYDCAQYLQSLNDINQTADIKAYSKIALTNYRIYLMFDDIFDNQIADALYRIGQTVDLIALNSDGNEELTVLSTIYFKMANQFKTEKSTYFKTICYYLAEGYEKVAANCCNSSNTIIFTAMAEKYYIQAIDDGYDEKKLNHRLSKIYSKLATLVERYEIDYTYQTFEEYIELSNNYRNR